VFAALLVALLAVPLGPRSADAATVSISGVAFQDLNRDGVQQPDEAPFVDHLIYLYDELGSLLATRRTGEDGRYRFSGVADGTYSVRYARAQWREIWADWVPTTTGSIYPEHLITVAGRSISADFGWRLIIKSDTTPITQITGTEGLRVQSFNDAVDAQEIYEYIAREFVVGDEAPTTTVRFARSANSTSTRISSDGDGSISQVRSTVNVTYVSWLQRGDRMLAHEYGHAWTNYHNYYVQQDVDQRWASYLEARGIDPDDDRVGSSYAWSPPEIAAEDYRQLLASENARSGTQLNHEIPAPDEVDGFEEWLRWEFTEAADGSEAVAAPSEDGGDEPATEDPDGGADGSEDAADETEGSPADDSEGLTADDEDPFGELVVRPYKVRGVNHAELRWQAEVTHVDIYRDGVLIGTTSASGYADDTGTRGSTSSIYRVCQSGTEVCSGEVEVGF
jgi:hypothetical protein